MSLTFAHPLGMPQPKIDEQARASMHEGGGVTDSGEPVGLLYTNLKDPSGLADLLLDERVDIRLVRGTCLKALDREKQIFIRRQELENHPRYPDAFVTREELQKWKTDAAYRSKVRIIGVSHVWETREHPDPRGNQLAMLAGAQLWHDEYSWYFLDYMSVYQFYRTSVHQNRSFQYTMMHMHFFTHASAHGPTALRTWPRLKKLIDRSMFKYSSQRQESLKMERWMYGVWQIS